MLMPPLVPPSPNTHTLFLLALRQQILHVRLPLQSEITRLCVYVLQIFSTPPAKSALPPSDSKTLACVIFGLQGLTNEK